MRHRHKKRYNVRMEKTIQADDSLSIKTKIIEALIEDADSRLLSARESYQAALEHSRSDDMKSEGKYDTRAIEAGYLASAKKQRVDELEVQLRALQNMSPMNCSNASLGALVEIELGESAQWNFLCPCAGPAFEMDGITVTPVSTSSPLAKAMLGLSEGDTFELETPKQTKEYLILRLL